MYTRYSLHEIEGSIEDHYRGDDLIRFLKENNLTYTGNTDFSVFLEDEREIVATGSTLKNVIKYTAVAASHRSEGLLASIMTPLMQHIMYLAEEHIFIYTSPANHLMFKDFGFFPVAETSDVILLENRKKGIQEWMREVLADTEERFGNLPEGQTPGAIVMNCDPFTMGHRYLIEYAANRSSILHLFILSSGGTFTPDERFRMVQEGTHDIHNVILHKASDYIVSPATFPTYFIKAQDRTHEVSCALDIEIFSRIIAPALHLATRFVGTEPFCPVTSVYNRMMRERLPASGINFIEIPRLEVSGRAVSASEVRRLYHRGSWEELAEIVPATTYQILKELPPREEITPPHR